MKIWRKCEKARLGGYFLTKWFRPDISLWILITAVVRDPEHLSKAPYGHRKHGSSLIFIFSSQKQTSVESEEGRNTTRPDTDIPDFLCVAGKWKTGSCVCFFDNFFFASVLEKIYKKKPRRTNMEMWGKHSSKSTEAPLFKGDTQQLSPC